MQTCDKNMIPVQVGDVLKVFHFTGARRKKHYMYKHVVGLNKLGGGNGGKIPLVDYFQVSHLGAGDESYHIGMNEGVMLDYEVVQGENPHFEDRDKLTPSPA